MMIQGYDKIYLDKIMTLLADMFDYAVNDCHYSIDQVTKYFITSQIYKEIEIANPYYIGRSGAELLKLIIEKQIHREIYVKPHIQIQKSPEYWCGYVAAYYQWVSQKSFKQIFEVISASEIVNMYDPLHEADIQKFVDVMNEIFEKHYQPTYLQQMRKAQGLSQSQLALKSGVSLRVIQAYEQREKNINKASVTNMKKLADTLHCYIEDLIEEKL